MTNATRIGIVGLGDMAAVHADGARQAGLDTCLAIGSDPARAHALAEKTGADLHAGYDDMLADPTIGGVIVCVPNHVHRQFSERAFDSGKHVLCEKPIALTLRDADAMIAAARRHGVHLMVGHVVRYWPEYRRLRELVRSGELGKGGWFTSRRLTSVLYATQGKDAWRGDPNRAGGAGLDLQIHDLDFICWLFGPPASVYAQGLRSEGGAWNHVVTTLRYGEGIGAMVEASFLLPPGDPFEISFRLVCGASSVVYRYSPSGFALHGLQGDSGPPVETAVESKPSLVLHRAGKDPQGLVSPAEDPFKTAIRDQVRVFAEVVAGSHVPGDSGSEARTALAVALASLQSCETGQAVSGPF